MIIDVSKVVSWTTAKGNLAQVTDALGRVIWRMGNEDNVIVLKNLVPKPSEWTLSNVTVTDEVFEYQANANSAPTYTMPTPIVGHKYYGRVMYKAPSGFSAPDSRFEYWGADTTGNTQIFQRSLSATDGEWKTASNILSFQSVLEDKTYKMRCFVYLGTDVSYRKEPMLIDLTEAFGAGNEPTLAWCDANIQYFAGTKELAVSTVPITFSLASDFYANAPLVYDPSLSYATIDGVEVGINKTKKVAAGTVVSCFARHIEGSMLLGHIKLNGSTVVTASVGGEWVSYDYTVTDPATINIASITTTVNNQTWSAGFVEIIEIQ